jgi:phosphoribosylformylglycinamidine synthase
MFKATVTVTPKKSVLDPQGEAVRKAIHNLGMECVEAVRVGRVVELEISGSDLAKTKAKLEEVSRDLLSNPVIEDFHVDLKQV